MDGVANEEGYDQYGDPMREDDVDDDETYVKRRMKTTLPTKDRNPWRRKKSRPWAQLFKNKQKREEDQSEVSSSPKLTN